jgi:XTP/dITP diphosphohydrolase
VNQKLLLATNNKGKIREYRKLLKGISYKLVTPIELGITIEVDEVGESFEENARLKATLFAAESGLLTLADDSGLEVDALGGEPGVLSHRFAGEGASDSDRNEYLLLRMKDVPEGKRSARFVCVIAVSTPDGRVETYYGECPGIIPLKPRGKQSFGYDPVMYIPEMGKTMAEMSMEEKNRISHRGKAARKVAELLSRPPFTTPGKTTS